MHAHTKTKGFTLIELLVAIALTGTITAGLLAVFFSFIQHQVSTQQQRDALAAVRFVLADINRELLFGTDYTCNTATGGSEAVLDSEMNVVGRECSCLTFTDQLNRRIKFRHNATENTVEKSTKFFDQKPTECPAASATDTWVPLSDSSVSITELQFEVETRTNTQKRIVLSLETEYEHEGETKQFSLQTQVTGRVVRPSEARARQFRIGGAVDSITQYSHFLFGENADGQVICRDAQERRYDPSLCEQSHSPVAAEFTESGLYVLTDNGLVFYVPQETITTALTATGAVGANPAVYVSSDQLQGSIQRVLGATTSASQTCRFCTNDPRGVVSLHPGRSGSTDYLYLLGHDGALYATTSDSSERDRSQVVRQVEGGTRISTIRHLSSDRERALLLYNDENSLRRLRLYKPTARQPLSSVDFTTALCTEFQHVSSQRCVQMWPDPVQDSTVIEPELLRDALSDISLSFIDRLQVINGTVHLWYTDEVGRHLVSIGSSGSARKRSLTFQNEESIDGRLVSGGVFAQGDGVNDYTFACDKSNNNSKPDSALCRVPNPFIANRSSFPSADLLALSHDDRVADHTHFDGSVMGISGRGRLTYFLFSASPSGAAEEIQTYNPPTVATATNPERILCGAQTYSDGVGAGTAINQQVSFVYLSDPHPTEDIVVLVGKVLSDEDSSSFDNAVSELYLLVPRDASSRAPYAIPGETNVVCAASHVERYTLPFATGFPQFDLVRLNGLVFQDAR